jgi:hypothetical protein
LVVPYKARNNGSDEPGGAMGFDLERTLRSVAADAVEKQDVQWEPSGFHLLEEVIHRGVEELESQQVGHAAISEGELESRVRSLVSEITSVAQAEGTDTIGAQNVEAGIEARGIWPFT